MYRIASWLAVFRSVVAVFVATALLNCISMYGTESEVDPVRAFFEIQSGLVTDTVVQLAHESEANIVFSGTVPRDVVSNSIRGDFTVKEALDRMLEGTPLVAVQVRGEAAFGILYRVKKGGDALDNTQPRLSKEPKEPTPMNLSKNNRPEKRRRFLTGLMSIVLAGSTQLDAQTDGGEDEDIFELSPFTVEGDKTEGYRATTTLAGTRIKSDLKDIATSISVYTKEFMEDTGSTNLTELLVYSTGTEVSGMGGNLTTQTSNNFNMTFDDERFVANSTTRVRGLANADNTRNYFSSIVPLDSYNTSRVTVNRGANNILFGLGSPAGIIDRSLSQPMNKDTNEVSLRTDNYGSIRGSFDINRVLIEDKLKVRVAGLHDWREFRQDLTFDKTRRLYGALDYQIAEKTVFRANFEVGDRDGAPQVLAPPRDKLNFWYDYLDQGTFGVNDVGSPDGTDIASNNRNSIFIFGGSSNTADLGIIGQQDGGGYVGAVLEPGDPLYDSVDPALRSNYTPRFNGANDPIRQKIFADRSVITLSNFSSSPQITDTSIYDYNTTSLGGRNDRATNDFYAYNFTLQHEMLDGDLGIELAYDLQHFNAGLVDSIGSNHRNRNINVDVNEFYPNGDPNPNVGRAFISALGGWADAENLGETSRLTAYYKFDAEEKLGDIGRWFGNHTFTGLLDKSRRTTLNTSGPIMSIDHLDGAYSGSANTYGGFIAPNRLYYISDDLRGTSSPAGLHLSGIPDSIEMPSSIQMSYINQTTRKFETSTHDVLNYIDDKGLLTQGANSSQTKTESSALAWQSSWFDNLLVGTAGWRHDSATNWLWSGSALGSVDEPNSYRDPVDGTYVSFDPVYDDEQEPVKANTFSWGAVLHTPQSVKEKLPLGMDVSLHYGESENFDPKEVGRNPFGGFYDLPTGTTTDYGATLSFLDEKIVARMTWYETNQENISDSRVDATIQWMYFTLPQQLYSNNLTADVEAANFLKPPAEIMKQYEYNYVVDPLTGQTRLEGTNIAATDIISAVSEGFELDLTANLTQNWRVSFNAARQKASRDNTAQTTRDSLFALEAAWKANPAYDVLQVNSDQALSSRVGQVMNGLRTAMAADGQNAFELREWRANLITNYNFTDGKAKGWGVGGGLRWQSKSSIGVEYENDPDLGWIPLVNSPVWGPEDFKVDTWVSYKKIIFNDIDWSIQLNIRNLLNEDGLIPVFRNPDGSGDLYRIEQERTWSLTSTFKF